MKIGNFDDLERAIRALESVAPSSLRQITRLQNLEEIQTSLGLISKRFSVESSMQRELSLLQSSGLLNNSTQLLFKQVTTFQRHFLHNISNYAITPEIKQLSRILKEMQYGALPTTCLQMAKPLMSAPNIAALKAIATHIPAIDLPRGYKTFLRTINSSTARVLAKSTTISFNATDRCFFVKNKPHKKVSVGEMNIISAAMDVLGGITEEELIMFLDEYERTPSFASSSETGRKIYAIIASWNTFVDLEQKPYYHARHREDGQPVYSNEEMRKAPQNVTSQGRYNPTGIAHYYFADTLQGAVLEVRKHCPKGEIQVATLRPVKNIKMIDLSLATRKPNKFLEYCRKQPDLSQKRTRRREYNLPNYVADCCKRVGIQGIKYYGSSKFFNFVSWEDEYFEIVENPTPYEEERA